MKTKAKYNINGIHLLTTGTVEQHFEHRYGSNHPVLWWVLTSRSWITVPIHCFLIAHNDGVVLFDTGIDPAIATDSNYIASPIGRILLRRIFRFHVSPEDGLAHQMAGSGFFPSEVSKVVLSHLHFDHIGGIASVPQAKLIVSADEWRQLSAPHPERDWILREHIEIPDAKWRSVEFDACKDPALAPFTGCHDLMGDGSLMLLPTPRAHTRLDVHVDTIRSSTTYPFDRGPRL